MRRLPCGFLVTGAGVCVFITLVDLIVTSYQFTVANRFVCLARRSPIEQSIASAAFRSVRLRVSQSATHALTVFTVSRSRSRSDLAIGLEGTAVMPLFAIRF